MWKTHKLTDRQAQTLPQYCFRIKAPEYIFGFAPEVSRIKLAPWLFLLQSETTVIDENNLTHFPQKKTNLSQNLSC